MKICLVSLMLSFAAAIPGMLFAGICDGPPAKPGSNSPMRLKPVQSCDPNEIRGPMGMGARRLVEPGMWMEYDIYFENKSLATAAAQEVRVVLALDVGLDADSFECGEIVFGPYRDFGLEGRCRGETFCRLAGSAGQVKSAVSMSDGVVSWYLRSWDERTADRFPSDAVDGFLPPNDDSGRGEGRLRFRVRVRPDAEPGTIIRASATIVFDDNEAIETNPSWWNVVFCGSDEEIAGLLVEEIASARDGDRLTLPSKLPLSAVEVDGSKLIALGRTFVANPDYVFERTASGIRVRIDRATATIGSGTDVAGAPVSAFVVRKDVAEIGVERTVQGFYYVVESAPDPGFAEPVATGAVQGTGKSLQLAAPKEGPVRFYRVKVHDELPARR